MNLWDVIRFLLPTKLDKAKWDVAMIKKDIRKLLELKQMTEYRSELYDKIDSLIIGKEAELKAATEKVMTLEWEKLNK